MACSNSFQRSEDFISNVLDIVCDQILDHLPISIAAQTSVLSKRWRRAWLSLKKLNFNDIWRKELRGSDKLKCRSIISSVLFHHNGPVHDFQLYIPSDADWDRTNLSQWIYFLSKNGVRKIVIRNSLFGSTNIVYISSYIFWCSELIHLELQNLNLTPSPADFSGFPKLKRLLLDKIVFSKENIFSILIENCRMLETLGLVDWSGMDHIVIDAPSLQTLILGGNFESLAFRNVRSLRSITLYFYPTLTKPVITGTIDVVNLFASSCQLQYIDFERHLWKFFAAGIKRSPSITFNHLRELCLRNQCLSEFGVFRDVLFMIKCCPFLTKLDITVNSGVIVGKDIVEFNYNYNLDHLREVNIKGITGSSAELKLVEYLLAISPVLENLFFESGELGIDSEPKMSRALMGFPRASPKARLLFLN